MVGAATFADGNIRWAMLALAAVFFSILVPFLWIVWNRPANLYSPKDYGGETGIEAYVAATRQYANPIESSESLLDTVRLSV